MRSEMTGSQGDACPGCGAPALPSSLQLFQQRFCESPDCHVLMWNPDRSLDELLASDVHEVDLPPW